MKTLILRRTALAAGLAVLAWEASATTMSPDPVIFQGVFAAPLVQGAALKRSQGARLSASLRLTNNSGQPLRLSGAGAVTLELIDGRGAIIPFAGGANGGQAVTPSEAVAVAPGKSLTLPVRGTLRLAGRELSWRGDDGLMGAWQVDPAGGAYSLRLRYRPLNRLAWQGEGVSRPALLPLRG